MPEAEHPSFDAFVRTIAKLRSPEGGCPWNRAQTHESIGDYMIEEAYEAVAAIDDEDWDHVADELGDVLLQIVFHARVGEDTGTMELADILYGVTMQEQGVSKILHLDLKQMVETMELNFQKGTYIQMKEKN